MLMMSLALAGGPVGLERVPSPIGAAQRLRLPSGDVVESDAAVVLTLRPGMEVPSEIRRDGVALGPSERSWRVAAVEEDALAMARRWAGHPAVSSSWPDVRMPTQRTSFDDPSFGAQWYLEPVDHAVMMELSQGDPEIRVAVIDSAVDIDHSDLSAGVVAPYDARDDDDDPRPIPGMGCANGSDALCDHHGTGVSGIVMARADNGIGIAGICPSCSLIPIRLLGDDGITTLASQVAAFEHAIANDAAVINNSWGYQTSNPAPGPLVDVIRRARTESRGGLGAVVVFSAGNEEREVRPDELQGLAEVLTVSAFDVYGFQTNYTNRGAIDLSAPSATVTLEAGGGTTETFGGTSAAAPVVSGVAAWVLSLHPDTSADALHELLIDTARPISPDGERHPQLGWGRVDALALHDALSPADAPPPAEETRGGCACSHSRASWWGLVGILALMRRYETSTGEGA